MFLDSSHQKIQPALFYSPKDDQTQLDVQLQWQHSHMMRQDYEGLFYRKLNLIIMLEESQQAYHQRETLMISHREKNESTPKSARFGGRDDVHPVSYLAKEMVKQNDLIKKEMRLRKKQAELKVEMNKLQIDKKCLFEEVKIFSGKIIDISEQYFQGHACREVEALLIEHGKRYNLTSTIVGFIKEAKEITAHSIVNETLRSLLKRVSINGSRCTLKLQDFKQASNTKSKRQLLEHITLYLKQFRSSTVYKELTDILHAFMVTIDKINLQAHYLYNKIAQEIQSNLTLLSKTYRKMEAYGNQLKDYKIEIEILAEETKIAAQEIKELQSKCTSCISEEAAYLSKQFGVVQQIRSADVSFVNDSSFEVQQEELSDHYAYFHQQLKSKYQQFLQNQLQDAEHIRILREKIEGQTAYLQKLKGYLHPSQSPNSELQTHRTNDQSAFSQFSCTLKEHPSNKLDSLRSNNHPKQQKSCVYSNSESLQNTFQFKKQKFLVKKVVNIGSSTRNHHSTHKGHQKVYELKVTKKHLIFQQKTNNVLRVNQKVALERIKGHKIDENEQIMWIDCGLNCLKLHFLSKNVSTFTSKLSKLYGTNKQNKAF